MQKIDDGVFLNVDIDDLEVPPLPRAPADTRGFIYLVEDTAFPDHIKIGRTINMKKRMAVYNSDKPFNTTKLIAVSRVFDNANYVEKKILEHLYAHTSPTTLSREWFEMVHKELCLTLINDAEGAFE
jgi:hypothetical protein